MNLTNLHSLPESLVRAIQNDGYDLNTLDLSMISVTTLIAPPKIRMLKQRHAAEIEEDVSDRIWALLGSSVHSMLERGEDSSSLVEERLSMQVGMKTVSGKTDIYHDGEITDYKVTSSWSVVYNPDGKIEWEQQLNCLALLYKQAGFEVKSLKIVAILRDWSAANAKKDADYPQIPAVVISVPLWTSLEQLGYVKQRVADHMACEIMDDDSIPVCTPHERWQSKTTHAVYKNDNKRAAKVCDTHGEAVSYVGAQDSKHLWRIEERPGEDKRCASYCPVAKFCNHGRTVLAGIKPLMLEV